VQFDMKKLLWFNEQWVRTRADADLADQLATEASERFGCTDHDYLVRAIGLMKERMVFSRDLFSAPYLFQSPDSYDEAAVAKRWKAVSAEHLLRFREYLASSGDWTVEALEETLKAYVEKEEVGMGAIMFPLRMALSGTGGGPSLYALMALIGKQETLDRIDTSLTALP